MENKENRIGTMKIPKLIIIISAPMIFSLLMNSLYGVVDSIFIAHYSKDALTALSLATPIQVLVSALGSGIAVGLNALISKYLGEKNHEAVKKTASAAIWLAFMAYGLIVTCSLLFLHSYFIWQTNGNSVIMNYGESYLSVCLLFSFGQMLQWVFDRFLISTGKSTLFLITLSVAAITNLILDPILIFGYFGFPSLGTAGAGIATVIGQIFGAIAGIVVNIKLNHEIPIHFTTKPDWNYCRKIVVTGIPTAMMQSLVSVMGIFINTVLIGFSTTAVSVYGICAKIQNLATIGVHGINVGVIPIIAYNYGAKRFDRIKQTVKWSLIYSFIIMFIICGILEIIPDKMLYLFDATDDLLSSGVMALRILAISYFISTLSTIISAYFQAIGKAGYSLLLTIIRQVFLLAVFIIIFIPFDSLELIWLAFVLAELLPLPLAIFLYKHTFKKVEILQS